MNINDVPGVHPCTRRKCYEDKTVDYFEVLCDGKTHINICYVGGVEVRRSKAHDCDRWRGYAQRVCELKP